MLSSCHNCRSCDGENVSDFPEILKNPQHEEIYDISKAPVEIWCEIPSDMFVAALII